MTVDDRADNKVVAWTARKTQSGREWEILDGDGKRVAMVREYPEQASAWSKDAAGNVELVTAAPELLQMCQDLDTHCRVETPGTRGNPAAHAAEGQALRDRLRAIVVKFQRGQGG